MTVDFNEFSRKAAADPPGFLQIIQPGGHYDPQTGCYYAATPQGGKGNACVTSLQPGKMFHGKNSKGVKNGWKTPVGIAMARYETTDSTQAVRNALQLMDGLADDVNATGTIAGEAPPANVVDAVRPRAANTSLLSCILTPLPVPNHQQVSYVEAAKDSCRSQWCQTCFRTIHWPKIAAQLMQFDYKNTVMVTCTFDPSKCGIAEDPQKKNGKIHYPVLIELSPISAFIYCLKRRKVKGMQSLRVLGYIAFLEFSKIGNPHYHLIIHFADYAYREHDLQRSWKHGDLYVQTFSTREEYLDFLPYLRKDPLRYSDKAYQVMPPQDWLDSFPRIVRVLSSHSIPLGTPRPNRKRSPKKDRNAPDADVKRPVEYNKGLKSCGQKTSLHMVLKGGKEEWQRLPIPYAEFKKLPGKHLKNKRYLLDDPDSIQELFKRPKPRSKKKRG